MKTKNTLQKTILFAALCIALSACGNSNNINTTKEDDAEVDTMQEENIEADVAQEESGEVEVMQENTEEVFLRDGVKEKLDCLVGCAVGGGTIKDKKNWELVTTHFSAVTLENELKPDALFGYSVSVCPRTEEAVLNGETIIVPKLDYSRAEQILDKVLEWNRENPDKTIMARGHVLLWHSQTPEWFFHKNYDKNEPYVSADEMNKRLEWYISEVLGHFTGEDSKYKGMFYGWDVVNEAISDATGTYRTDKENPDEALSEDRHGSNSSWWHIYQNEDFIVNAFVYANKYAPAELELYYNDYNECNIKKRKGIIELLTAVKNNEDARIDGMGMQGHYNVGSPSATEVEMAAKAYGEIVGKVQITEWDLSASSGYDGSPEAMEKEYEKQRKTYNLMYNALQNVEKAGIDVTGITFWGTTDANSWLNSRAGVGGGTDGTQAQCPLLFDAKYEPKPAFYVFAGGSRKGDVNE